MHVQNAGCTFQDTTLHGIHLHGNLRRPVWPSHVGEGVTLPICLDAQIGQKQTPQLIISVRTRRRYLPMKAFLAFLQMRVTCEWSRYTIGFVCACASYASTLQRHSLLCQGRRPLPDWGIRHRVLPPDCQGMCVNPTARAACASDHDMIMQIDLLVLESRELRAL